MRYLLTFLILTTTVCTSTAEVLCANKQTAHVRSYPSSGALVRLEVPLYYPFVGVGESGSYYEVSDYLGRTGWVDRSEVASSECVVVTRSQVNVRQGPGTDQKVLFKAQKGVAFAVLQSSGKWTQVRHETGKSGWIYNELVWGAE